MAVPRSVWLGLAAVVLAAVTYVDFSARDAGPAAPATSGRNDAARPDANRSATGVKAETASSEHPLSGLKLEDLSETLARPLFEASRRRPRQAQPPPPPVTAAPPPPPPTDPGVDARGFRLVGVVAGGDRSTALIMRPSQNQAVRVESGDVVDGWEVGRIGKDMVELKRQREQIELRLIRRR